jgi:hypothetical protein
VHVQAAGGEGLERENGHTSQTELNDIYISNLQRAEALIADGAAAAASSIVAEQRIISGGGREGKQKKQNSCNV